MAKTLGAWTNRTRKVLLQLSTGGGKSDKGAVVRDWIDKIDNPSYV